MVEMLQTTGVRSNRRAVVEGNPVPVVHLGSAWVYQGAMRLDANHYSSGATSALLVLDRFAGNTRRMADLVSECYVLGRFKRVYATDDEAGWPYLSPAETFQFRPASERWIARRHAPAKSERHFALPGWILVSASGAVGRPLLTTSSPSEDCLTGLEGQPRSDSDDYSWRFAAGDGSTASHAS